jgi:hypothetical protein
MRLASALRGIAVRSALLPAWSGSRDVSAVSVPVLLDVLWCPGYSVGLLKKLGELVRLHVCEAHEDELW